MGDYALFKIKAEFPESYVITGKLGDTKRLIL
jgi:hypothetical protein